MKVSVIPILQSLRDIYDVEDVMPRFQAYLSLMLGKTRGEPFPLGAFSPMGKRQADYLDALMQMDAESIARKASAEASTRLSFVPDTYRVLLVVLDEKRNGWTQRYLTDSEWRFENKYDDLHQDAMPVGFDRWVTVQLWTDEEPTENYVYKETQASIYRAAHRKHVGIAKTLEEMLAQEGRAMVFAGYKPDLDEDDISYSREVLEPYQKNSDLPVCFTAFYGDKIAKAVGYRALGLSSQAGFSLAMADATTGADPEQVLHAKTRTHLTKES